MSGDSVGTSSSRSSSRVAGVQGEVRVVMQEMVRSLRQCQQQQTGRWLQVRQECSSSNMAGYCLRGHSSSG